jgi:(4S)-4-hydroxy-5-phosphonooxypentane-2,3-dione isomerase
MSWNGFLRAVDRAIPLSQYYNTIGYGGRVTAFAITVDFALKPGSLAAFRKLIDKNATDSCADEPGCRRFDVLAPENSTDRVFLYEIYDDRAAFEAHLKTPHYDVFNRESAPLVLTKKVTMYDLACEGSRTSK